MKQKKIIVPSGLGNATPDKVREGYTFTSDSGVRQSGTIPSKAATTYTPGTAEQEISAGQYLTGKQTIAGDADLIPANIRQGVNIFGVDGELLEEQVTINGVKVTEPLALTKSVSDVKNADIPLNFTNGGAVVLNGEIHALGGGQYDYYSYSNLHYKWDGSSWTRVSTLPQSVVSCGCVVLYGDIHVLGSVLSPFNIHYKWNGSSWTQVSTLPVDLKPSATVVYNGKIHILGFGTKDSSKHRVHYEWTGSKWTELGVLPYHFYRRGRAVVHKNEIHLLGCETYDYSRYHYKWDGSSWTRVSTLPYSFYDGIVVVYKDKIHILSGAISPYTQHYEFNGSSWTDVGSSPYRCYTGQAVIYKGYINLLGGGAESFRNFYTLQYAEYEEV